MADMATVEIMQKIKLHAPHHGNLKLGKTKTLILTKRNEKSQKSW